MFRRLLGRAEKFVEQTAAATSTQQQSNKITPFYIAELNGTPVKFYASPPGVPGKNVWINLADVCRAAGLGDKGTVDIDEAITRLDPTQRVVLVEDAKAFIVADAAIVLRFVNENLREAPMIAATALSNAAFKVTEAAISAAKDRLYR